MALGAKLGSLIVISSLVTGCALHRWGPQQPAKAAGACLASSVSSVSSAASSTGAACPVASSASAVASIEIESSDYQFSQKDIDAMILNAFNEARGESPAGIRAVLAVTMARVESACYPDSVHEVVYQRKQFSWTWQQGTARTLTAAKAREPDSYLKVKLVVTEYIASGAKPSQAMLYHTRDVNPGWAKAASIARLKTMGSHIFYVNKRC
nr:cell wall hydrolase [uncultured Deefgea sp.]